MAVTVRVRLSQYKEWARRLNERIVRTPSEILNQIGAVCVATSQRSFREQRLGSFAWPARYPHQSGLKLNIAGAVSDLKDGPNIKRHRFDDRPALIDKGNSGGLLGNIAFKREGSTVVVGSNLPYASLHQGGGVSRIAITQVIRDNLKEYMAPLTRAVDRAQKGKVTGTTGGEVVSTLSEKAVEHKLRLRISRQDKLRSHGKDDQADKMESGIKRLTSDLYKIRNGVAVAKKSKVVKIRTRDEAAFSKAIGKLSGISQRLGFLLSKRRTSLTTKVHPRPFIGIDDKTQVKLIRIIERDLPKGLPR